MAVRVRIASAEDARAIAAVHVRAWRAAYRGLVPEEILAGLSVERREETWRNLLEQPKQSSYTLVAIGAQEEIEGFCTVAAPSRDDDAGERTAEIAATYVDPARWRSGVGSALLSAALGRLRESGWRAVTLWVLAANDRARPFYSRFGFRPNGAERRQELSGGVPEIRLRAEL